MIIVGSMSDIDCFPVSLESLCLFDTVLVTCFFTTCVFAYRRKFYIISSIPVFLFVYSFVNRTTFDGIPTTFYYIVHGLFCIVLHLLA